MRHPRWGMAAWLSRLAGRRAEALLPLHLPLGRSSGRSRLRSGTAHRHSAGPSLFPGPSLPAGPSLRDAVPRWRYCGALAVEVQLLLAAITQQRVAPLLHANEASFQSTCLSACRCRCNGAIAIFWMQKAAKWWWAMAAARPAAGVASAVASPAAAIGAWSRPGSQSIC